jgi:hypothetical protein
MDLWEHFSKLMAKSVFAEEKIFLGSRKSTYLPNERAHSSFSAIADEFREIKLGELFFQKMSDNIRYIYAKDISYDLFVSIYSVSNEEGLFFRLGAPINKIEQKMVNKLYSKLNDKHIEVRIVGMQSKQQNAKQIVDSLDFIRKRGNRLVEADLFGGDIRHVAIDLKTGLSYNILVNNVVYKPGELANKISFDEFSKNIASLKLV